MTGHQEPHVTNGTATAASNPSDAGWRGPVSGAAGGRHCWCGEPLAPTGVVTPTFRLLRCAACGTHAIDPPPIDSDAQSGDFYTAYYSSHAPAHAGANGVPRGRWSRYWRVVQKVPDLDRAGQQAIDFGSGEGRLCFELSEAGWQDVAGLDVSRARVARARQLYPSLRFFDCAIEETPLPHG
ncbi:MAG: class I SAM-dependent methyltransferase, partial [Acidobacteria bacterium]|nr:class I SAM-dependent methyltransferase [Acidobacteriota bacterium]